MAKELPMPVVRYSDLEHMRALRGYPEDFYPLPLVPVPDEYMLVRPTPDELLRPSVEAAELSMSEENPRNNRAIRRRARHILTALDKDLARRERLLSVPSKERRELGKVSWREEDYFDRYREALQGALDATTSGDWDPLEQLGLSVPGTWLTDIVRTMLQEDMLIEIDAIVSNQPDAMRCYPAETLNFTLLYDYVLYGQEAGIDLAASLRRLPGFRSTRPVITLDDDLRSSCFSITQSHRDVVASIVAEKLQEAGVILPDDIPGRDFLMISRQRSGEMAEELIQRLYENKEGLVVKMSDGSTVFRPYPWVCESSERHSFVERENLIRNGIVLQDADGYPSQAVYEAAPFLAPARQPARRVVVRSEEEQTPQRDLDIILRSLHLAYDHPAHAIAYDAKRMHSELFTYTILRLVKNALESIIRETKKFNDINDMDPMAYLRHNYGGETWAEDVQGAQAMTRTLASFLRPGSVNHAVIFGYGPFSWPALAIMPYMSENGSLDLSDILPKNVEVFEDWQNGWAAPIVNDTYKRFARLCYEESPDMIKPLYANCEERLRQVARPHTSSLEALPSDSAQVIVSSFVVESSKVGKPAFQENLKEEARVLKWDPDSIIVALHMVESEGWNNTGDENEGVTLEATNISMDGIAQGYENIGMQVTLIPLSGNVKIRKGYKCMALAVARPITATRPFK